MGNHSDIPGVSSAVDAWALFGPSEKIGGGCRPASSPIPHGLVRCVCQASLWLASACGCTAQLTHIMTAWSFASIIGGTYTWINSLNYLSLSLSLYFFLHLLSFSPSFSHYMQTVYIYIFLLYLSLSFSLFLCNSFSLLLSPFYLSIYLSIYLFIYLSVWLQAVRLQGKPGLPALSWDGSKWWH